MMAVIEVGTGRLEVIVRVYFVAQVIVLILFFVFVLIYLGLVVDEDIAFLLSPLVRPYLSSVSAVPEQPR